jgi:hypothetical protein
MPVGARPPLAVAAPAPVIVPVPVPPVAAGEGAGEGNSSLRPQAIAAPNPTTHVIRRIAVSVP